MFSHISLIQSTSAFSVFLCTTPMIFAKFKRDWRSSLMAVGITGKLHSVSQDFPQFCHVEVTLHSKCQAFLFKVKLGASKGIECSFRK